MATFNSVGPVKIEVKIDGRSTTILDAMGAIAVPAVGLTGPTVTITGTYNAEDAAQVPLPALDKDGKPIEDD